MYLIKQNLQISYRKPRNQNPRVPGNSQNDQLYWKKKSQTKSTYLKNHKLQKPRKTISKTYGHIFTYTNQLTEYIESGDWALTGADPIANTREPFRVRGSFGINKKTGLLAPVAERSKSIVPVVTSTALPVSFSPFPHSRSSPPLS